MRSESLNIRLEILEPVTTVNDFGEEFLTYKSKGTVYADRVKMTGKRSEVIAEHFPSYSTAYDVYIYANVKENWRCQEVGGYLYDITNIIPNEQKDMQTLICERVNE